MICNFSVLSVVTTPVQGQAPARKSHITRQTHCLCRRWKGDCVNNDTLNQEGEPKRVTVEKAENDGTKRSGLAEFMMDQTLQLQPTFSTIWPVVGFNAPAPPPLLWCVAGYLAWLSMCCKRLWLNESWRENRQRSSDKPSTRRRALKSKHHWALCLDVLWNEINK